MRKIIILNLFLAAQIHAAISPESWFLVAKSKPSTADNSWTPPAGLVLRLEADNIVGLTDGQTVTTWPDSSGLGNNATATGSPVYKTSIMNGKPVVRFSAGGDDWFDHTDYANARSVIMVVNPTAHAASKPFILGSPSDADWHRDEISGLKLFSSLYASGSVTGGTIRTNGVSGGSSTTLPDNQRTLITIVTTAGVHVGQVTKDRINAGRSFVGDIAAVLIWTNALSAGEITAAETYFTNKYFP
jgi:hypothetical protein